MWCPRAQAACPDSKNNASNARPVALGPRCCPPPRVKDSSGEGSAQPPALTGGCYRAMAFFHLWKDTAAPQTSQTINSNAHACITPRFRQETSPPATGPRRARHSRGHHCALPAQNATAIKVNAKGQRLRTGAACSSRPTLPEMASRTPLAAHGKPPKTRSKRCSYIIILCCNHQQAHC